MDLSLTNSPAYVPDSLEFFALGDVYRKGSGGCQVPKMQSQGMQFQVN